MNPVPDPSPPDGVSVTDLVGLVLGAAVAAAHLRGPNGVALRGDLPALFWIIFALVGLTAAGPFVALGRRLGNRDGRQPAVWDGLWVLLGTPWILAIAVGPGGSKGAPRSVELYPTVLVAGVMTAALLTPAIVGLRWVLRPGRVDRDDRLGWSASIGLLLAAGWPVQCGLCLVLAAP